MAFSKIKDTKRDNLIWTVHPKLAKSQARKGNQGNKGSFKPTVDSRAGKHSARIPDLAKRGARAGTGNGRALVTPTRTASGQAGRTCRRGSPRRPLP